MSASLVGSEMCIRDRFRRQAGMKELAILVDTDWAGRRKTRKSTSGGMAVSYTHLTLPTICSV
eukprot:5781720-Alexandrium_andersonii.AAC.1